MPCEGQRWPPLIASAPAAADLICGPDLMTDRGLGDKTAAFALAEQAMNVLPLEKDAPDGPAPIEVFARVAAQLGEPDRAIASLQKLLSIPSEGALASRVPLTSALLRLDPMFDPLRNDSRFQKLAALEPPKRRTNKTTSEVPSKSSLSAKSSSPARREVLGNHR